MSSEDDGGYQSDGVTDDEQMGFPESRGGDTVDFGWDDTKKLSGRRKKAQQAAKKKAKPGSFGTSLSLHQTSYAKSYAHHINTLFQGKCIPLPHRLIFS